MAIMYTASHLKKTYLQKNSKYGKRLRATLKSVKIAGYKISRFPKRNVTIAGFGITSVNSYRIPSIMQKAQVGVIENAKCKSWYGHSYKPRVSFCAGYERGGIDSCSGDSGGPIFETYCGHVIVYGVTSWGSGCAVARQPGIYAHTSDVKEFLKRYTVNGASISRISPRYISYMRTKCEKKKT